MVIIKVLHELVFGNIIACIDMEKKIPDEKYNFNLTLFSTLKNRKYSEYIHTIKQNEEYIKIDYFSIKINRIPTTLNSYLLKNKYFNTEMVSGKLAIRLLCGYFINS